MMKRIAVTALVVIVVVGVALLGQRPSCTKPVRGANPEPPSNGLGQAWTQTEFGRTRYVDSSSMTQLGESGNSSYSPKDKHWTFGIDEDTPKDLPKVKFHFLNAGRPQLVHDLSFRDLRRNGASRIPGGYHCTGVSFYKAGPPRVHGGWSCTLLLCTDDAPRMGDNLYLGRTYFMGVKLPEPNRFGSESGCTILTIPARIPKGESFLVEVDVSKLVTGSEAQKTLRGLKKLNVGVNVNERHRLHIIYYEPDGAQNVVSVSPPARSTLEIRDLGGELSVLRDRDGFVTYHISKVDNLNVTLPRDADWSANADDTFEIALDLPLAELPGQGVREICLSLTREGTFVIWGSPLKPGQDGKVGLMEEIKLRCKPGVYFVKYRLKCRQRATEYLGRIGVGKKGDVTWLERAPSSKVKSGTGVKNRE